MVAGGYHVTTTDNSIASMNQNAPAEAGNGNCLLRLIQKHYTIPVKVKTESQVESEKWLLLGHVAFNRWFLMPAAFIIQFCCGSLYAWSVFNKPIDNLIFGSNVNIAPITFYVAIGFYGSAAGLAGPWLERKGPRHTCLVGASIVLVGNLITAVGLHLKLMSLVFIGYGAFVGAGFGICYISPVSTLQKWFPDMRGLGAGFATCGFGAGSIVVAKIQIPLMDGLGLPLTFVTLGAIFIVLMAASSLVLRTPPPNYVPRSKDNSTTAESLENSKDLAVIGTLEVVPEEFSSVDKHSPVLMSGFGPSTNDSREIEKEPPEPTLMEALMTTDFRMMMVMFVGDIAFGLVLAARLANIIIDVFEKTPEEAATVVSVNGGVNFVGRLLFSIASDYVGRKYCFILMLTTQVVVLGLFSTMTNGKMFYTFWILMSLVMATYGAAFGVIPAFLTDKFGPTNIGACHGIFIAAWAGSGVIGGLIFTLVFNSLISSGYSPADAIVYNINTWWLFAIACTGWMAIHFVKPTLLDIRFKHGVKRVFSKICCKNN